MQIDLPGAHASFEVKPGVYLWRDGRLHEITAQTDYPLFADDVTETAVFHAPAGELPTGEETVVCAEVVAPEKIDSVVLYGEMQYGRSFVVPMIPGDGFVYTATVPAEVLKHGIFRYRIGVYASGARLFPGNCSVTPGAWDDYCQTYYRTRVVTERTPALLLDAQNNTEAVELAWQQGIRFAYLPEGIAMEATESYRGGAAIAADMVLAERELNRMKLETGETAPGTELIIELLDRDGYFRSAEITLQQGGTHEIPLSVFQPTEIHPVRDMYPGFSFAGGIAADKVACPVGEITSVRVVLKKGSTVVQKITLEK